METLPSIRSVRRARRSEAEDASNDTAVRVITTRPVVIGSGPKATPTSAPGRSGLARALLPDAAGGDLLASILCDGAAAREAWHRWSARHRDPRAALARDVTLARSQLASLCDSVRRNGLPVDEATATYLRSAFLTESLRSRTYRTIVADLASRLRAADVPFLLIKGAATGELYYSDPSLRHAHDVEVAVNDAAATAMVLQGAGFRPAGGDFIHTSGLPLRLHPTLFGRSPGEHPSIAMPDGSRTLPVTHALALALLHAARSPSRATGRWASDARYLIATGQVAWHDLVDLVTEERGLLPVRVQLRWLRDTLQVAVPDTVLSQLEAIPISASERRKALQDVRAGAIPLWRRIVSRLRLVP